MYVECQRQTVFESRVKETLPAVAAFVEERVKELNEKIYISPSDQNRNLYAVGNTNEAVQCRAIAQAMVAALERCGFETRVNLSDTMEQRVAESNTWGADLYIAVHTNAFNGQVQGTRLFSFDLVGEGFRACQAVIAALAPITPGSSDSITARPELYEVRTANAPTVYVEVAFHDNEEEAAWIIANTVPTAEAITRGICSHFGVPYVREGEAMKGLYNTLDQVPGYARATIGKLLDKDYLVGKTEGLALTEDMIRLLVINDRAGLYD